MKALFPLFAIILALSLLTGTVWVSRHHSVQIQCASDVMREGEPSTCAAEVDYPPDQPKFKWDLNGECGPRGPLDAPNIEFVGNERSKDVKCELTVSVYDGHTKRVLTSTSRLINIEKPLTGQENPLGPPPPVESPVGPSLRVDSWPNSEDHVNQDSAMITGTAGGVDLAHCRVALYRRSGSGWSLYLTTIPDPENGRWGSSLKFAPGYAAILVRDTVRLEESLKQLPKEEDGVLRVVQSSY